MWKVCDDKPFFLRGGKKMNTCTSNVEKKEKEKMTGNTKKGLVFY